MQNNMVLSTVQNLQITGIVSEEVCLICSTCGPVYKH